MPNARLSNYVPSSRIRNDIVSARIRSDGGTQVQNSFAGPGYLIGFPLAYTYISSQSSSDTIFGDPPHVRINNI